MAMAKNTAVSPSRPLMSAALPSFRPRYFRSRHQNKVGPFVLKLPASELVHQADTRRIRYRGLFAAGFSRRLQRPVFSTVRPIAQVNSKNYKANPEQEMTAIKNLILRNQLRPVSIISISTLPPWSTWINPIYSTSRKPTAA